MPSAERKDRAHLKVVPDLDPDPRFIAAKNQVQVPKAVAILRGMFMNWKVSLRAHRS